MLVAKWHEGRLDVTVMKSKPGFLVVEGQVDRRLVKVDAPTVVNLRSVIPPKGVWWLEGELAAAKADKLPSGEHGSKPKEYSDVPDSEFAGPGYTFPVNTEARVHSALAYFTKHPWGSSAEKKRAARKILSAAKKFGVAVDKDDNVYQAAHGSD